MKKLMIMSSVSLILVANIRAMESPPGLPDVVRPILDANAIEFHQVLPDVAQPILDANAIEFHQVLPDVAQPILSIGDLDFSSLPPCTIRSAFDVGAIESPPVLPDVAQPALGANAMESPPVLPDVAQPALGVEKARDMRCPQGLSEVPRPKLDVASFINRQFGTLSSDISDRQQRCKQYCRILNCLKEDKAQIGQIIESDNPGYLQANSDDLKRLAYEGVNQINLDVNDYLTCMDEYQSGQRRQLNNLIAEINRALNEITEYKRTKSNTEQSLASRSRRRPLVEQEKVAMREKISQLSHDIGQKQERIREFREQQKGLFIRIWSAIINIEDNPPVGTEEYKSLFLSMGQLFCNVILIPACGEGEGAYKFIFYSDRFESDIVRNYNKIVIGLLDDAEKREMLFKLSSTCTMLNLISRNVLVREEFYKIVKSGDRTILEKCLTQFSETIEEERANLVELFNKQNIKSLKRNISLFKEFRIDIKTLNELDNVIVNLKSLGKFPNIEAEDIEFEYLKQVMSYEANLILYLCANQRSIILFNKLFKYLTDATRSLAHINQFLMFYPKIFYLFDLGKISDIKQMAENIVKIMTNVRVNYGFFHTLQTLEIEEESSAEEESIGEHKSANEIYCSNISSIHNNKKIKERLFQYFEEIKYEKLTCLAIKYNYYELGFPTYVKNYKNCFLLRGKLLECLLNTSPKEMHLYNFLTYYPQIMGLLNVQIFDAEKEELMEFEPAVTSCKGKIVEPAVTSYEDQIIEAAIEVMTSPYLRDGFYQLLKDLKTSKSSRIREEYSSWFCIIRENRERKADLFYSMYLNWIQMFDESDKNALLSYYESDKESFLLSIEMLHHIMNALPKEEDSIGKFMAYCPPVNVSHEEEDLGMMDMYGFQQFDIFEKKASLASSDVLPKDKAIGKFLKYRLGDALTKVKYFDELLKYHPQIMRLLNKTQKSNIEQIGKNIVAVMKNPNHVDGFFRLLEDIKTADDQIVEAYSKLLLFMKIKDPVRSELIQTLNYPIYRKGLSIFDDFDRYLLLCFFQHNQNYSLMRLVLYSMCETDSERDRGNQLVKSVENYDESFLPRIDVLERITNALPKEEYIDKVLIHYQPIMRLINKVEASRRCQMAENIVGVITNIHLKVGFCQLIGAASDSEIEEYSIMFAAMHEDIEIAKELINMMKRAFYKFLGIIENGN